MSEDDDQVEVADDLPPYPLHWTAEQRTAAYWWMLRHHINVGNTAAWPSVLARAEAAAGAHQPLIAEALNKDKDNTP
jgi:hypothetical protein